MTTKANYQKAEEFRQQFSQLGDEAMERYQDYKKLQSLLSGLRDSLPDRVGMGKDEALAVGRCFHQLDMAEHEAWMAAMSTLFVACDCTTLVSNAMNGNIETANQLVDTLRKDLSAGGRNRDEA